jgi:hypothetical protein
MKIFALNPADFEPEAFYMKGLSLKYMKALNVLLILHATRGILSRTAPEHRSGSSFSEGRKPEWRSGTFFLASI